MVNVKKHSYVITFALLALLGCVAPRRLEAQFIGYISQQSTAQTLFTNQAANATSVTITNIGQSSHFLTVCNSLFVGTVSLEASIDGTFSSPITISAANYGVTGFSDSTCHVIQAGGYYPAMRGRIKNYSTGNSTVFYTGIGGPIAPAPAAIATLGPSAPISCDLPIGPSSIPAGTTSTSIATNISGETIILCSMTLSFSAATTAGTIAFTSGTGATCTASTALYTLNITANTPQIVHIVGPPGGLFRTPVTGQNICIATGAITAAVLLDATYAQISF